MNIRPFTETDWDAFAGAEQLPDGTPPHIAETDNAVLILSGDDGSTETVAAVYLQDEDAPYILRFPTVRRAFKFAQVVQQLDVETLEAFGFEQDA